jgi:hypothetical protein
MSSGPQINPYAPPASLEPPLATSMPAGPPYQLYSVGAVALAAALGSAAAGGVLMMLNYQRLGKSLAGQFVLGLGILVTATVLTAAVLLPESTPSWPFLVMQAGLSYALARVLQHDAIEQHKRAGGRIASLWWGGGDFGRCQHRGCRGLPRCAFGPSRSIAPRGMTRSQKPGYTTRKLYSIAENPGIVSRF